ncbi:porin [Algihabitans albus]|uniref:porin n=1 Tax=Algihabitans albus TaxID=2164067 RepID=UPI0013C377C0|nr:porin [Algihabitans albus]
MKKVLMGTTAIGAVALMAGPAAAQDGKISLGVGGYYENFFTFVEQDFDGPGDNDYNQFNVRQEGEIHFTGETTLDNGLTVGFQAQLEAITQGDQIDETFLYFEGSWGRLVMGSENSAPYLMQYTAPSAGLGLNDPNIAPFQQNSDAGTSTLLNQVSDSNKITYFTPRFAGFQLGASYTPNIDATGGDRQSSGLNTDEDPGDYNNFFGGGANFVESFNGFDVAVAGGIEYGMEEEDALVGNPETDDFLAFSGGVNVGFAGFTVGGSVLHSNGGLDDDGDTLVWDVGATYGQGPWEVGVTYLNGETETVGGDDQLHRVELGANYRLSPGVRVIGALQYSDDEDSSEDREEDAWGVIIGTRLDF